MNQLLAKLEGSFEKLAECLHLLDEATDDATLEPFLVCFSFMFAALRFFFEIYHVSSFPAATLQDQCEDC